MSVPSAIPTTFNNNLLRIVTQLSTNNPSCYSIRGSNTVTFTNVSESILNKIFDQEQQLDGYSGGSFIHVTITDIQTSVSANGSNNVTTTQRYNSVILKHSSQQINFNSAIGVNSVVADLGSKTADVRYKINNGNTIGDVVDYSTAPFGGQSTNGVEKLISGAFVSTIYTPPGAASILAGPGYCPMPGSNPITYTP